MDIISVGESLIDFTPGSEKGSYIKNPGGAPANFAVGISKNGLNSGIICKLGDDDFGWYLRDILIENEVEVLVKDFTKDAVTTLAFVTIYDNAQRSFTFVRNPGADMLLCVDDVDFDKLKTCKLVNSGSFSLSKSPCRNTVIEILKFAKEHNKLVSFDVNYRSLVWNSKAEAINCVNEIYKYVDFLKISDEEVDFVGGQSNIFDFMKKYDIAVVVVTFGKDGSKYFFKDKEKLVETKKVKAVDSTGAGDAFWSGFISYLISNGVTTVDDLSEDLIEKSVLFGNVSGALSVTRYGGIPSLPTRDEIIENMKI